MSTIQKFARIIALVFLLLISIEPIKAQKNDHNDEKIVQAHISLTVSESKRLIAQAIAQMPILKKALKDGMVIITKGTTNTYIAEEILGKSIESSRF